MAELLVRWALDGKPGRVLEPSFGDGSFLWPAVRELGRLGGSATSIVAIDIDPAAGARVKEEAEQSGIPPRNVIIDDFLAYRPASEMRFDAVVGNPPFVRHHWLHRDWISRAQQRTGGNISSRASAWAYFVWRAADLLEDGGRLALVLPAAALHADYARSVVEKLERSFGTVELLRVAERLFQGAEEEAVILLAASKGKGQCQARVREVRDTAGVAAAVLRSPNEGTRDLSGASYADYKADALGSEARTILLECMANERVRPLHEVAQLKIGVVTGANGFFVRRSSEIPNDMGVRGVPVISRSVWLKHPFYEFDEFASLDSRGERTRLLAVDEGWVPQGRLAAEIDQAESDGIRKRHHVGSRGNDWWRLRDTRVPDAFLPYMGSTPRGLVLNEAQATCTNAVHRVDFVHRMSSSAASYCASTWTSLFAVCAELAGRWYGGGVLKLEPRKALQLPVVEADSENLRMRLLKCRSPEAIREAADNFFLVEVLGLTQSDVDVLRAASEQLAARRTAVRH